MSAAREVVNWVVRGPAAWLTIDRTERRNALNPEVVEGLLSGLHRAAEAEDVRVVVLTGAGDRAFCAGADLTGMSPEAGRVAEHFRRGRLGDLLLAIMRHPKPVIGRANGAAVAGGLGLLLACDLVLAAEDAEFGTPEVDLGLWPFMISAVIRRNVPRKLALEMMLTGRRLSAAEAEGWGIVNRAVAREKLDDAVAELVSTLASKSPVAIALGKESFSRAEDMPLEEAMAYLNAMLTVGLQSEDVAEGVSAFLEKRAPRWRGR